MRYIIFPQAKNILPALGNEFVTVIKESSVVSVIGVSELIFQAGNVQGVFKTLLTLFNCIVNLFRPNLYYLTSISVLLKGRMSTSD